MPRSMMTASLLLTGLLTLAGPAWAEPPTNDRPAAASETVPPPASGGVFTEPTPRVTARAAFDAASGATEHVELPPLRTGHSGLLFFLFTGAGLGALGVTAAAAARLSRITRSDGTSVRGLTIGSRLVLGCGVLTAGILGLGAVATRSSVQVADSMDEISELDVQGQLVNTMHSDVLMVRMAVKNFLLNNTDADLRLYANSAAGLADKLGAATERVADTQCLALLEKIEKDIDGYHATFTQVVNTIDERNAKIDQGSLPAALRASELLKGASDWLHASGKLEAARQVDEVQGEFQNARVAFFRFLRKESEETRSQLTAAAAKPRETLRSVLARTDLAEGRPALEEAAQAIEFWAVCTDGLEALQVRRNDLVINTLDKVGPQIAATCDDLLKRMDTVRGETEARATAVTVSANRLLMVVGGLVAGLGAFTAVVLTRAFLRPVRAMLAVFSKVADGDLTQRVKLDARDEMGELSRAFDTLAAKTHDAMSGVASSAQQVAAASTQIAASAEEMARGMDDQSRQVQQVSAAVAEMSSSVSEIAAKASETSTSAGESGRAAREGGEIVGQTVGDMQEINSVVSDAVQTITELGKRGEQIGQIIAVINDIADQTNLLALNAAIEAARAGEHGRGFAVVADEVRKLAERTTNATQEVAESIGTIRADTQRAVTQIGVGAEKVQQGVGRATTAGRSMKAIVEASGHVAGLVQSIAAAGEEQAAATEQITRSVEQMASVAKEANAGAGQAAQAAAELSVKAEELKTMVSRFKI